MASEKHWKPVTGDYVPAGESGYTFLTVLEKYGDKVLLPRSPFPSPVWFDFKRAFGHRLGEKVERQPDIGPYFVFSESQKKYGGEVEIFSFKSPKLAEEVKIPGDFVPVRIEGKQAILRTDPGTLRKEGEPWSEENIIRLRKDGKEKRIPLNLFFDKDEHLTVISASGC